MDTWHSVFGEAAFEECRVKAIQKALYSLARLMSGFFCIFKLLLLAVHDKEHFIEYMYGR